MAYDLPRNIINLSNFLIKELKNYYEVRVASVNAVIIAARRRSAATMSAFCCFFFSLGAANPDLLPK